MTKYCLKSTERILQTMEYSIKCQYFCLSLFSSLSFVIFAYFMASCQNGSGRSSERWVKSGYYKYCWKVPQVDNLEDFFIIFTSVCDSKKNSRFCFYFSFVLFQCLSLWFLFSSLLLSLCNSLLLFMIREEFSLSSVPVSYLFHVLFEPSVVYSYFLKCFLSFTVWLFIAQCQPVLL